MSDRPTPETDNISRGNHVVPTEWAQQLERERDEAREDLHNIRINLGEDADGFTLLHAVCALQNERDEARAVADELSAIAARYLGWHLSRTPMGPDDDHLAQSRRISETLARWKSLASA